MKLALTDKFCERAKPGEWFDDKVANLSLRVGKNRKTWVVHTTKSGARGRLTIGHYPSMPLAAARRVAVEGPTKSETVKSVCEEFLSRADLRTVEDRRSAFERLVYPALGDRPIGEVKRSEIVSLLDDIADSSGPVMADRTLAYLRKVFNWYASRSDDFRSPLVMGMARTKPRERERDRILTDAEIKAIWNVETEGSLAIFHSYVCFLLLTAVRRTEASKVHAREIKDDLWLIPAERMKGKVEFVVPLSALDIASGKGFVFSTDGGKTPISGFSKFKADLDKACGVTDWTLHDLRRTARSLLSRAGVSTDVVERCLAHKIGGVRGVYDRYEYLAEKRDALAKLAALVATITAN